MKRAWDQHELNNAVMLICVTTWCFLLYIDVYDCCDELFGCASYKRGIKLCILSNAFDWFSCSQYVYIFET